MIYQNTFFTVFLVLLATTSLAQLPCGPRIGDYAPHFKAQSTRGPISFPPAKWVVFFSHPADFTPVCTTEFKKLAHMVKEFAALNTAVIGISVDQDYVHQIWMRNLEKDMEKQEHEKRKVAFPVIADPRMKIVKQYGMIHPHESTEQTVRSVYIIDPKGKVRAIFHYPIANGRNFDEIKRTLLALQTTDKEHVATPVNWRPGRKTIPLEKSVKDILPN